MELLVAGNEALPDNTPNSWSKSKSKKLLQAYGEVAEESDTDDENSSKSRARRLRVARVLGVTQAQLNFATLTLWSSIKMARTAWFPFRYWRPTIPILERSLPESQLAKDPWAKREAWRNHAFWSRSNRVKAMFPGLGIASVAFAGYLAYDHWYYTDGPGKAEQEKWARWMEEREKRLHGESAHH
ncbi:hypothetical protein HDV05_002859 [Chytridiales sp. JEL 0842]|nr:hypothetical protein HDV05_002859 [Chytridiales sp. JEL 0842]